MTNSKITDYIIVPADPDLDDCLAGAASAYIEGHPELAGYDLSPRWVDEGERTHVALTVPEWFGDRLDAEPDSTRGDHMRATLRDE